MDDITIKIDNDYDTVMRIERFLVSIYFGRTSRYFVVEGKTNAGIYDELNETIFPAILNELKRLNANYRGV